MMKFQKLTGYNAVGTLHYRNLSCRERTANLWTFKINFGNNAVSQQRADLPQQSLAFWSFGRAVCA